ncbi:uncharacterized protein [Globicephala melas]|uniref:uncharacterized protein n=1 Tax=Globicephala melas TaxID=9731 RepID=UPI00293D31E9|nr:uncharacterized protein LOC132593353 [Globicephala melas]
MQRGAGMWGRCSPRKVASGRRLGCAEKTGTAQVGRGWRRGVIRGAAHLALRGPLPGRLPWRPTCSCPPGVQGRGDGSHLSFLQPWCLKVVKPEIFACYYFRISESSGNPEKEPVFPIWADMRTMNEGRKGNKRLPRSKRNSRLERCQSSRLFPGFPPGWPWCTDPLQAVFTPPTPGLLPALRRKPEPQLRPRPPRRVSRQASRADLHGVECRERREAGERQTNLKEGCKIHRRKQENVIAAPATTVVKNEA